MLLCVDCRCRLLAVCCVLCDVLVRIVGRVLCFVSWVSSLCAVRWLLFVAFCLLLVVCCLVCVGCRLLCGVLFVVCCVLFAACCLVFGVGCLSVVV